MKDTMKKIKKALKKELEKDRYEHTLGVMYTAGALAMANGSDIEQAMLAGLLHDCAKCIPNETKLSMCKENHIALTDAEKENPFLIHAKLGAFLAEATYGVKDTEICHAISVHTTGAPAMNLLDKIIFVADYIEPNRDKAVHLKEIRQLAFADLDQAVLFILKDTLEYLDRGSRAIDPMTKQTYEYYEEYLKQREK
ncbi:MAG: bis(5'-nucleosyl)-tetraphosphatase (symmetrical) YqeK [Lachnospiraceae bacterium]